MRTACKGDQARWRATSLDSPPRSFAGQLRAGARFAREGRVAADPQPADRGRIHGAGDRSAPLDQRDVDRKLAVAGEEFPRSVERIHQQETLGDAEAALRPPSPPRRTRAARALRLARHSQMMASARLIRGRNRTAVLPSKRPRSRGRIPPSPPVPPPARPWRETRRFRRGCGNRARRDLDPGEPSSRRRPPHSMAVERALAQSSCIATGERIG